MEQNAVSVLVHVGCDVWGQVWVQGLSLVTRLTPSSGLLVSVA